MSPIRPLRHGYTTGSCATAAAKAAVISLIEQKSPDEVEITLPMGEKVMFKLHSCSFDKDSARCSVIKDGGDDPDVTDGAEISAEVGYGGRGTRDEKITQAFEFNTHGSQVMVYAGKGVGVITKHGLALPPGEPAINPVPRKMIRQAVEEALVGARHALPLQVIISVPDGEQIARGTLNERLGIIGGISILGTTGIVKPISTKAWADTISVALDVARAAGLEEVVLTTGRTSERVAMDLLKLPQEAYIQMGDHVGYTLNESVQKGFRMATIAGQFGKLTKIASGEFETNVRDSRLELKTLADLVVSSAVSHQLDSSRAENVAVRVMNANTAREAFFILMGEGMEEVVETVCRKVCENARGYLAAKGFKDIEIDCILVGYEGEIVFAV